MKVDFNKLVSYSENCKISGDKTNCAKERANLCISLMQIALKNNFELDDKQIIISSSYSNEAIMYVIFEIYGKLPTVILTASEKSKIVQL